MTISIAELETLILTVLQKEYTPEEAQHIKEVILFAELTGKETHGILRLLPDSSGPFVKGERGKIVYHRKTKVSTLIDGNNNPGMLVGPLAMRELVTIAKEHGIGVVGAHQFQNSTGALEYYNEYIAKENLISIIFAESSEMVAPFTSKKALFGTNPFSFGFPGDPDPLIFDMATSAITFGGITRHHVEGTPLPLGVAIDKEGKPTTDPEKALEGAILTFDNSYKGSGLSMMVEVLGGVLPHSGFMGVDPKEGWGTFFLAFTPDLLSDVATFKVRMKEVITILKTVETRDGNPIRIPGEVSLKRRQDCITHGSVDIPDDILQKVRSL